MRRVMRRAAAGLVLCAAVGFLAAGCGSGVSSAVKSLAPSVSLPSISPGAQPAPAPTAQPSVTQTAAQPAPANPAASSPTPSTGSGSSLTWLWILIGAVVVISLVVLAIVTRHFGRRSVVLGGWLSRALDAYAQGSALHDAMSIAARPEALTAADSGARWADIQRRADGFAQALYALRESAAEADDRARVEDVLAALQAVRSGMDAQRAIGGADAEQAGVVQGRLLEFERALRELRPSDRRIR
jgi:hypothetical protein